jgi:hypothetical protein
MVSAELFKAREKAGKFFVKLMQSVLHFYGIPSTIYDYAEIAQHAHKH